MPTNSAGFTVFGAIEQKWLSIGGPTGPFGHPVSQETATFDGVGRFQNFQDGRIISWHPETGAHIVFGAIAQLWRDSGQERFGYPITDEITPPDGRGRFNHFRAVHLKGKPESSIYWTQQTGPRKIFGGIREKWAELGFERSFLGYPIGEECPFTEAGNVQSFEKGTIYWWPDTGSIALSEVAVQFKGIFCFGETDNDQLSTSDEPYVVMGIISPSGSSVTRSQIFNGVDQHEARPDLLEIYRGRPSGLTVTVLLMEHDDEDPDRYKGALKVAVDKAAQGLTQLIELIPDVGPVLSTVAGPILAAVSPAVVDALNGALDLGDDEIDTQTVALSAKQMIVLAGQAPLLHFQGIDYKIESPLLSGLGATYKAYFGLEPLRG